MTWATSAPLSLRWKAPLTTSIAHRASWHFVPGEGWARDHTLTIIGFKHFGLPLEQLPQVYFSRSQWDTPSIFKELLCYHVGGGEKFLFVLWVLLHCIWPISPARREASFTFDPDTHWPPRSVLGHLHLISLATRINNKPGYSVENSLHLATVISSITLWVWPFIPGEAGWEKLGSV